MSIKKVVAVLAVALTLAVGSFATTTPAHAGMDTAVVVATGGGSSTGAWIVGGLVVSVLSIIACAAIIGSEQNRELTLEEALFSGTVPLGCLIYEDLFGQP
ncbi:MAG: hypothetical protein KI785_00370 [Devosiaceae bacterium]|nr:hypothetical protein [Devosiaceae bacterium MH13]